MDELKKLFNRLGVRPNQQFFIPSRHDLPYIVTEDGRILFRDDYTSRWFSSNMSYPDLLDYANEIVIQTGNLYSTN